MLTFVEDEASRLCAIPGFSETNLPAGTRHARIAVAARRIPNRFPLCFRARALGNHLALLLFERLLVLKRDSRAARKSCLKK